MIRTILSIVLAATTYTSYAEIKEPTPGSSTWARDTYDKKLAENKIIENKFGNQCPVRYEFEKSKGIKFDKLCLKMTSGWKYHDIEPFAKMAAAEPALNARIANIEAKKAKLAELPGVRIGMTADQVRSGSSWGLPQRINRTVTAKQTTEQWIYGSRNYLYFTNGVLTAIQN